MATAMLRPLQDICSEAHLRLTLSSFFHVCSKFGPTLIEYFLSSKISYSYVCGLEWPVQYNDLLIDLRDGTNTAPNSLSEENDLSDFSSVNSGREVKMARSCGKYIEFAKSSTEKLGFGDVFRLSIDSEPASFSASQTTVDGASERQS